jgi:hypothetical protein
MNPQLQMSHSQGNKSVVGIDMNNFVNSIILTRERHLNDHIITSIKTENLAGIETSCINYEVRSGSHKNSITLTTYFWV